MSTLKLTGERIALREHKAELDANIEFPPSVMKSVLGEIVAVGNGLYTDGTKKPIHVNVGDVVLFGKLPASSTYEFNGEKIQILHQQDAYARLKGNKITINEFEILSDWVLLLPETTKNDDLIQVPDKYKAIEDVTFTLVQKGSTCTTFDGIPVGSRVYPEPGRLFPIHIDGVAYMYTLSQYIYGAVVES